MPAFGRTLLHARAAEALERQPAHASLVPWLAHHYLAAHVLGFHERALPLQPRGGSVGRAEPGVRGCRRVVRAGRSNCPSAHPAARSELLLAAGSRRRAGQPLPRARDIYERLDASPPALPALPPPWGYEDATSMPGAARRPVRRPSLGGRWPSAASRTQDPFT